MSGRRRRVAITGMGAVTPFGRGLETLWENVCTGRSGAGPITLFDPADMPVRFACEVPDAPTRGPGLRVAGFSTDACDEAWIDARLPQGLVDPERIGLCWAVSSLAPEAAWFADEIDELLRLPAGASSADFEARILDTLVSAHGGEEALGLGVRPTSLVAALAERYGAEGSSALVNTSCPGSLQALILAAEAIRDGELDVALAGGGESLISMIGMMGFARLQALSTNNDEWETASRPFDRRRDGFVMGEGAGALMLEDWDLAVRRGATIHAEWLGTGLTCDAYKLTDEHPEGVSAIEAVRRAVRDAGVEPSDVGYVNAHGSSTPMNDRVETLVMHRALGDHARRVPVSSTKSMLGHMIHAAAVVEIITTVLALQRATVPPTAHLEDPDPRCDLDYVPHEARPHRFDVALKNAFGFGGINAAVVLGAAR